MQLKRGFLAPMHIALKLCIIESHLMNKVPLVLRSGHICIHTLSLC